MPDEFWAFDFNLLNDETFPEELRNRKSRGEFFGREKGFFGIVGRSNGEALEGNSIPRGYGSLLDGDGCPYCFFNGLNQSLLNTIGLNNQINPKEKQTKGS